jgi:hypothetical protein
VLCERGRNIVKERHGGTWCLRKGKILTNSGSLRCRYLGPRSRGARSPHKFDTIKLVLLPSFQSVDLCLSEFVDLYFNHGGFPNCGFVGGFDVVWGIVREGVGRGRDVDGENTFIQSFEEVGGDCLGKWASFSKPVVVNSLAQVLPRNALGYVVPVGKSYPPGVIANNLLLLDVLRGRGTLADKVISTAAEHATPCERVRINTLAPLGGF